jgi:hypothetical protein
VLTGFLGLIALALVLRVIPAVVAPHGAGVDQWFWRAYIEKLRATKIFPPQLPQFLLDEAQWYPPLFPVLLSKLPATAFSQYGRYLAVLIDLLRLLVLVLATRWLSGSDQAALIAGAAYSITPVLVTYNMQLNPRGMAALFLDLCWLTVAALLLKDAAPWLWCVALLLAGLVLLTHKMTTQIFWFIALAGAGISERIELALLVPGGMVAAYLLSGGFYRKVLSAHADIASFWRQNWHWSGSNPILESPVYGEPGFESPTKYYRGGWRPWLRRLQFVLGFNPWMPAMLVIGAAAYVQGYAFSRIETWVFAWLSLCFAFALLTTLVPVLRCLGQGYLYGYNGGFPAALALGMTWYGMRNQGFWQAVVALTVLACVAGLTAFFRTLRTSRTMKVDAQLEAAIERLAALPEGVVMCFPQHWHDVVAYRTRQPVLFGGHGYGFRRLQCVFPRLLEPVGTLIAQHQVKYLLTYEGYCNARFLADLPTAAIECFGEYRLYRFSGSAPARNGAADFEASKA